MKEIIQFLRDWSEVWALLIPLLVTLIYKPRGHNVKWLLAYVIPAFIFNFLAIFMMHYYYLMPFLLEQGNNIFYNLHSFIMVIFFSCYIITDREYKYTIVLKALLAAYFAFVLVDFSLFESPFILSTRHFATGSVILLFMCLFYFFRTMLEESPTNWLKEPSFIVCVGLCLYEAITFFIFLFIYPLFNKTYNQDLSFALLMMKVYEVSFVIFCIFLAIGLYQNRPRQLIKPRN